MDKYVIVKYNSYGIPFYLQDFDKIARTRIYAISIASAISFYSKRNAELVKDLMVTYGDSTASIELIKG